MFKFVCLLLSSAFLLSLSSCGLLKLPSSIAQVTGRTLGLNPLTDEEPEPFVEDADDEVGELGN